MSAIFPKIKLWSTALVRWKISCKLVNSWRIQQTIAQMNWGRQGVTTKKHSRKIQFDLEYCPIVWYFIVQLKRSKPALSFHQLLRTRNFRNYATLSHAPGFSNIFVRFLVHHHLLRHWKTGTLALQEPTVAKSAVQGSYIIGYLWNNPGSCPVWFYPRSKQIEP